MIDVEVAKYWRDHWDLSYILERDWQTLGPKLQGKLHFAVGMMDNYYLDQSVYLTEQRMAALDNPRSDATFQYGIRGRHSWIGHSPLDPGRQMTYAEFITVVGDFVVKHAPEEADSQSWQY